MDEYIADQVLQWYERIEQQILRFAECVPLTIQNETIQAPTLVTCLMDACGLLDSVFRNLMPDPVVLRGKQKPKKECGIQDFAEQFSECLDLSNTRSILLVSPPRYYSPFEPWDTRTPTGWFPQLQWWETYNNLKHDRLSHIHEGTLGVTLNALCALHQVLARSLNPVLVQLLVRRGWLYPAREPENLLSWVRDRGVLPEVFVIQTKLFAVPSGRTRDSDSPNQFPSDLTELKPYKFQAKRQFYDFLGMFFGRK